MKKIKFVLFLVLIAVAVGGIFAQEKYDGSFKNTFTAGFLEAGYERSILPMLSVGAEVGFSLFAGTSYEVFARWYPWQRIFFANLALGYQDGKGMIGDLARGFLILPQVGWKIDIGDPGAWIFEPKVGYIMIFGSKGLESSPSFAILFGRTF